MSANVEANFREMNTQLRLLEKKYNPEGKNLHFEAIPKTDEELFDSLQQLSVKAIEIVKKDGHRYSNKTAYADVMFDFWYDFFLIISAASSRVIESANADDFPQDVIYRIVADLIDISEFSTIVLGDLYKRNYEALGNTLIAFYNKDLIASVQKKRDSVSSKTAKGFLDVVLKGVARVRDNKQDRRP